MANIMNKKYFFITSILLLSILLLSFDFSTPIGHLEDYMPLRSGGAAANGVGDKTGSPLSTSTCSQCHSGGSFSPNISVVVLDNSLNQVTSYIPGENYTIEYTVSNNTGSPAGFGMQSVLLSSNNNQAGDLTSATTPNTQIVNLNGVEYVDHQQVSSTGVFTVNWTAPSAGFGNATIYAVGLSVNGNGGTSGDQVSSPVSLNLIESCSPATVVDTQVHCNSYTWTDGNTYTSSNNTATQILTSAQGCDSVVTLNLMINNVDVNVTQTNEQLSADASGANYQWLNCPSNTLIANETNQSFVPSIDGSYAVIVNQNGCVDTSACYSITGVGIIENSFGDSFVVYPNPTYGEFSVNLGENYKNVNTTITDLNGRVISSKIFYDQQLISLNIEEPKGVYMLIVESDSEKAIIRLIKE